MAKTTWLNNEPFKEKECPDCHRMLRQTRVRIGKNGLKAYRIYVHKDTRKKGCAAQAIDVSRFQNLRG